MPIRFSRVGNLFYGWRMIAVGSAIRILGGGLHLYGFTVFFLPVSQELGLSRAATSLVFSLARAEGAIEGPVAGYMIDRFGPRPVVFTAVIMSGMGYMLLSGINSYTAFLLVYLGVISLSFASGFMHSPMVLANTWFIRRRALAMTLISASIGMGGTLITPLLAAAVHTWGWRQGALLAGIGLLILGLPLASLLRRSPEAMGLLPDGDPPGRPMDGSASDRQQIPQETNFTVKQAMGTSAYWMIILATTARVTGFSAVIVHFIPMMVWKGVAEQQAAYLLATFAFLSLPSHLLLGWLADYVNKPRLMGLSMIVGTIALLFLIFGQDEWTLWLFAILFTTVEAIFPVSWATVGDFFGRKNFGTIRGSMSFFHTWGGVAGPVVAGAIFDRTQSYGPMFPGLAVLFLIAAALYASLVRPAPRYLPPTSL
ncbi:MAG: MFS transporter [Deltaproteobacteria bacterium]|nr:MFS transporter [Deltaproteobacteria bacterium]